VEDEAAQMMARSHALLGAAGWLAAAPLVAQATHHPLDPPTLAASTVVCAGAALLPDMDHPEGLIATALGPFTRLLAKGVEKVSGGHRHATHSLLFGGLMGLLSWALVSFGGRRAMLALAMLCAAFALRAVRLTELGSNERLHWPQVALVATAVTWTEARFIPGVWLWLPVAVAAGCWLHLVADLLTPEGVPLLWPWRARAALPVIDHTDSWGETYLVVPTLGVANIGLAWVHFSTVRTAAVGWLVGLFLG
jgi:membrane-bound metal-dependent hydrolase YbcI (DUF457 family)